MATQMSIKLCWFSNIYVWKNYTQTKQQWCQSLGFVPKHFSVNNFAISACCVHGNVARFVDAIHSKPE